MCQSDISYSILKRICYFSEFEFNKRCTDCAKFALKIKVFQIKKIVDAIWFSILY